MISAPKTTASVTAAQWASALDNVLSTFTEDTSATSVPSDGSVKCDSSEVTAAGQLQSATSFASYLLMSDQTLSCPLQHLPKQSTDKSSADASAATIVW